MSRRMVKYCTRYGHIHRVNSHTGQVTSVQLGLINSNGQVINSNRILIIANRPLVIADSPIIFANRTPYYFKSAALEREMCHEQQTGSESLVPVEKPILMESQLSHSLPKIALPKLKPGHMDNRALCPLQNTPQCDYLLRSPGE